MREELLKSVLALRSYIHKNNYRGYDRYDGLQSPLFKWRVLGNRKVRFLAQQLIKRSPVNVRPLLAIPRGLNPVTIGLCLQANVYLQQALPRLEEETLRENTHLLSELYRLRSTGYAGLCWGYDFDWESRYSSIPAFTPTVVATGIISNALHEYYLAVGDESGRKMCEECIPFFLEDLNRTPDGDTFCFSYSPHDTQVVFNATMKGARFLAQAYALNGNDELRELARKTVSFVMKHQRSDGAWVYAHKDARGWVDNYHTGYILDALQEYIKRTADATFAPRLEKALSFYVHNFFENNTLPKLYDKKTYPIDSTSAAQSIITLVNFGRIDLARNVAMWVVRNFQGKDGHIYFRKYKYHTSRVSFMRWSNAWMYVALSKLLAALPEYK